MESAKRHGHKPHAYLNIILELLTAPPDPPDSSRCSQQTGTLPPSYTCYSFWNCVLGQQLFETTDDGVSDGTLL